MNTTKIITELTEALNKATELCEEYEKSINKMVEEIDFLTSTIEQYKLGKITIERKQMYAQMLKTKSESESAISKANAIKSEYEQKLDKITVLIKDVKSKQSDIDAYIDSEADIKLADVKADYIKHKKANDKALAKHKAENDTLLQEQLIKYKKQHKIIVICGVIGVIIGILGILL